MIAPEPQLAACLEVLYEAAIQARMVAWNGLRPGAVDVENTLRYVASLMDAIHNIPKLLQRWETCDESLLKGFLRDHDKRWQGRLLASYEQALADKESQQGS